MQKCKTCEMGKNEHKDDDGKKRTWVNVVGGTSNNLYCRSTATHNECSAKGYIAHTFQQKHRGTYRTMKICENIKDRAQRHSRVKKLGGRGECVAEGRDCVPVSK